jgi:hypothetical protein
MCKIIFPVMDFIKISPVYPLIVENYQSMKVNATIFSPKDMCRDPPSPSSKISPTY